MESGNHHQQAAAWRLTVEHCLRCQNWIAIPPTNLNHNPMCQPFYQKNGLTINLVAHRTAARGVTLSQITEMLGALWKAAN
jgi:hypothetical protein